MKTYKELEVECPHCSYVDCVEFAFEDFPRESYQTDKNTRECEECGEEFEATCTAEYEVSSGPAKKKVRRG